MYTKIDNWPISIMREIVTKVMRKVTIAFTLPNHMNEFRVIGSAQRRTHWVNENYVNIA